MLVGGALCRAEPSYTRKGRGIVAELATMGLAAGNGLCAIDNPHHATLGPCEGDCEGKLGSGKLTPGGQHTRCSLPLAL